MCQFVPDSRGAGWVEVKSIYYSINTPCTRSNKYIPVGLYKQVKGEKMARGSKPMPIGIDELRNRSKKPRTPGPRPGNPRSPMNPGAKPRPIPSPKPNVTTNPGGDGNEKQRVVVGGGRKTSAQKSPYRTPGKSPYRTPGR